MTADASGYRRRDVSEFDVEFGGADARLGSLDRGRGDLEIGKPLVVAAGRFVVPLAQLGGTLELTRCELDLGVGLVELCAHRGKCRLIGPGIDHEQQGALLDALAILEMDFGEIAAHPRPDLDIVDGGELPGELVPLGDLPL